MFHLFVGPIFCLELAIKSLMPQTSLVTTECLYILVVVQRSKFDHNSFIVHKSQRRLWHTLFSFTLIVLCDGNHLNANEEFHCGIQSSPMTGSRNEVLTVILIIRDFVELHCLGAFLVVATVDSAFQVLEWFGYKVARLSQLPKTGL